MPSTDRLTAARNLVVAKSRFHLIAADVANGKPVAAAVVDEAVLEVNLALAELRAVSEREQPTSESTMAIETSRAQ